MRWWTLLTPIALLAAVTLAQETSPLQVTAITPSPLPFKVGDAITFKLTVKNPTTSPVGGQSGFDVHLALYRGGACNRVDDPDCRLVWRPNRARVTNLIPAGGTAQVAFPGVYRVTQAAEKYCITACAIQPPNELCSETTVCATASCSYMIPLTVRPTLGRSVRPAATAARRRSK